MVSAFAVLIVCAVLLQACTHVHGPCMRKEIIVVETTCEAGGHAWDVRHVLGGRH
jgi:hypothetical protein